jgi:diguanylate cyclase (GGDEF)-like protein
MQRLMGEQQASTASFIVTDIGAEFEDRMNALELMASAMDAPLLDKPASVQSYVEQRPILQILFNNGVFVTRLDGTAIAEAPLIGRVGLNYLDRDHIAAALREGKATVGSPIVSKKVLAPSFAMTVPIRDSQGKVIGALAGITDLSKPGFLNKIMESKYGKTGGYALYSPKDRLVVIASVGRRIMEQLPARGVIPALDRMLDGYEGTYIVINARGSEVMNTAKSIPFADWRLIVTIPTEEAFAPIRDIQQRLLLAAIVLSLLAGALTWWALRRQLSVTLSTNELDRATENLLIANDELAFQNDEKGKRAAELVVANEELAFQNAEKGKRADELVIANVELAYQSDEKAKRAAELVVANVELAKNKEISKEVWELSFHDPLTNLPNRRLLIDRMTQIMGSSKRTGRYVALMMLDLDNFKPLNDLHGHPIGDLLLIEVSRRLTACVREVDTVARIGGDEFVVVLGELGMDRVKSTEQASEVAEKVRVSLLQPYILKTLPADSAHKVYEHHCSASIGVVVFANHEASQDDILKWADEAMYQSKHAGRNTIKVYKGHGPL